MQSKKHQKGMTLLELLVVVAIIGIIAAIAIVNYAGAVTRAKQKRTMADIRNIATAWESRAAEARTYQVSGFTFPEDEVAYNALRSALVPTYSREIPAMDGWGRALEFGATVGTTEGDEGSYAIRSAGRDGTYQSSYAEGGITSDPDCDIVFADGQFVQYPATAQSN